MIWEAFIAKCLWLLWLVILATSIGLTAFGNVGIFMGLAVFVLGTCWCIDIIYRRRNVKVETSS